MADTVRVQFSASIGALINGVEDAKKAITSVRTSVDSVTQGAKTLLETFGVAFSVDRIIDFASQMAEAGEQIERSAVMIGASTKTTQELGFAAKMTGGDTQTMAQAMERLQVSIERAQNPTSQQALALHALGLSAKELIGLPLDQQMNRFADAVSKFADGPAKTAAVGAINRGFIQMLPLLDQGSAGLQRLTDQAENTGVVMSTRTVKALSDLEHAGIGAKASLMTLGAELVALATGSLLGFSSGVATTAGNLTKMAETGQLGAYVLANLEQFAKQAGMAVAQLATAIGDIASVVGIVNLTKHWQDWDAAINKTAKQSMADLDAMLKKADADYKSLLSQKPEEMAKPNVPAINTNVGNQNAELQSHYQGMIKQIDDFYAMQKQKLNEAAAQHRISTDQESVALLQALDARKAGEDAAYDAEIAATKAAGKNYEAIVKQKIAADDKWALEHDKIVNEAIQKDQKEWQSALTPIQSAFDAQLKPLLSKTETWGQAMKKIFADLVMDAIKNLEKLAVEKAAAGLTSAFGGGPQSVLTSLFGGGGQAANTGAMATLTASLNALNVTMGGHAVLTTANTAATTANAGATGVLSGLTATHIGELLVNTAAIIPNTLATVANTVASFASKLIPSFDVGSYSVPGDMVAQIHQGEVILPNNGAADAFRSGQLGGGGSVAVNVNGNVGNQAWFTGMAQQIARALQQRQSLTPSAGW